LPSYFRGADGRQVHRAAVAACVAWFFLVVRGTFAMATGKVKWFNNAKGYGFILPEAGGDDLFAHYSSIQMDGYKTLRAGQDVEFDVLQGPKGMHAINIRSLEEQMFDGAVSNGSASSSSVDAPAMADASVVNGGSQVTS
jgi:cold shock protein